jgi:hypothetical protein
LSKLPDLPSGFNAQILNIPEHLTKNLTTMVFNKEYNQPLTNLYPYLTHITFDEKFNQSINNLPISVDTILFVSNSQFNQPVDLSASRVKQITFGNNFNQPIDKLSPELKILHLGTSFDHKIENLPPKLEKLYLSEFRNNFGELPESLNQISIKIENQCYAIPKEFSSISFFKYILFEDKKLIFATTPRKHEVINTSRSDW